MDKFIKIFKIAIGVLGGILFLRVLMEDEDLIKIEPALQSSVLSPLLYLSYFILGVCIVATIGFVIYRLFQGNVKKTLISVGAFLAVVLISFFASSGEETPLRDGEVLSAYGSKWVSTGLTVFYILIIFAFGAILFSSVKKVISNN